MDNMIKKEFKATVKNDAKTGLILIAMRIANYNTLTVLDDIGEVGTTAKLTSKDGVDMPSTELTISHGVVFMEFDIYECKDDTLVLDVEFYTPLLNTSNSCEVTFNRNDKEITLNYEFSQEFHTLEV